MQIFSNILQVFSKIKLCNNEVTNLPTLHKRQFQWRVNKDIL